MGIRNLNSDFVPASLRRPVAVASSGVPRFWSAVYEATSLAHLRNNTTRMHLHAIDAFYQHVEDIHGADVLDHILHEADADRLSTSLEGFFIKLRNSAAQTGSDHRDRWATVSDFVETILKRVSEAEEAHRSIHKRIQRLSAGFSNLRPNPKAPNPSAIRALPSTVLREIYAIFDPASSNNPFRGESRRWRNHCLLLAFLHQGLRRGEALLLPADAIKSGIDDQTLKPRHWINVQNLFAEEDPRFCDAPSIKNDHSVRQIPVSPDVARRFQHFYENYRGKSPYPHFFLNSSGLPLGSRSVSKIMASASSALSHNSRQHLLDAMREPKVTAHDLRHTCAVVRLYHFRAAGIPEDEALQKLRAFFGWTYESIMPRLYARAYWERHVAQVWNDDFDSHVSAIRAIEPSID